MIGQNLLPYRILKLLGKGGMVILLVFVTALATWLTAERQLTPPEPPLRKFQMPLDNMEPGGPLVSPDGSMIAYISEKRLWVRRLDHVEGREIPNTGDADELFWSPASDFIGYRVESTLWKVSSDGGNRTRLCELPRGRLMGFTWGTQGTITFGMFTPRIAELWSVSDRGGDIQPFIMPDTEKNAEWGAITPHYLPDGRALVYAVWTQGDSITAANLAERYNGDQQLRRLVSFAHIVSSEIVVHSPDTGRKSLPITGDFLSVAGYAPTGHLLYYLGSSPGQGDLWATRFSPETGTVTGDPFPVAQDVNTVSFSTDGTMVYRSSTRPLQQLAWVDRRGRTDSMIGRPQEAIRAPALSPDGSRVVVEGIEDGVRELWIHDTDREIKTRLTFTRQGAGMPVWTPDGSRIVFSHGVRSMRLRQNILYGIPVDGGDAPQPVGSDSLSGSAPSWSRDGRFLVYMNQGNLWYLDFQGDQKPFPLLQSRPYSGNPMLSPGNRYLAYTSNETGNPEVYVTRFPSGEGKWPISTNGGVAPKWSAQGDELFYVEEDRLMAVSVETTSRFRARQPETVFEVRPVQAPRLRFTGYDVSADGQRFVVVQNVGESRPMLTIVENWLREFEP